MTLKTEPGWQWRWWQWTRGYQCISRGTAGQDSWGVGTVTDPVAAPECRGV